MASDIGKSDEDVDALYGTETQDIDEKTGSADQMDEEFDVVDEDNMPVSKASRDDCHREGLLHRSTHVFLFRNRVKVGQTKPTIEVLLQRRSEKKKVGPGLWDVSVAEHLSTGEGYLEATIRGLNEELGLNVSEDALVTVRQPYMSRQWYAEASVLDNMFTTTFAALYDERLHGKVNFDEAEVHSVEWWPVDTAVNEAARDESLFTRWLLIELKNIDLKVLGKRLTGEM